MKIDSVNQAAVNPQKIKDEILKAKEAQAVVEEQPGQIEEQMPVVENDETADRQEDMPGVLRLLQEGHFKGVAALRLSINFHEEIMLIQNGEVKAAVERDISIVVTAVRGKIDDFSTNESLTEEQRAAIADFTNLFETDVNTAKDKFANGESRTFDDLTEELREAFNKLVEAIRALFEPLTEQTQPEAEQTVELTLENSDTVEEPIGEENQQPAESTEPQADIWSFVDEFISSMSQIFDDAMTQFSEGINNTNFLPPLTEPSGNGKAYDKFMAIYNDVYGLNPESIDAEAGEEITV